MPTSLTIKPSHKAIQAYYAVLKDYSDQGIEHETALRSAFQNLLADTGKAHGWTLVPELGLKVGGKTVRSSRSTSGTSSTTSTASCITPATARPLPIT